MEPGRWRVVVSLSGVLSILLILGVVVALVVNLAPRRGDADHPLGLDRVSWPASNPYSRAKVELGKLLYFDPRLSADGTVSCASCHDPRHGFADPRPVSVGVHGGRGTRNSPTVLNAAYFAFQFWDGRASSLEEQSLGPIVNPVEMANTHAGVEQTLRTIPGYGPWFQQAFGSGEVSIDRVAKAIGAFERTVLSGNSPYDRYKGGGLEAMTEQQYRGLGVFVKKGQCSQCHLDPLFTDNQFHNIGVGTDGPNPDSGRFQVTRRDSDWGAFKTPGLRDVEKTGPYMHDGSMRTLEEVVDFYDKGGTPNRNLDKKMGPLRLTGQDKKDLIAFLRGLTGDGWQSIQPPESFPR
ncbi:MAG: cytochrome-c peroxidase [Acidobacteria bacterium]|nr:cytochrome-c peroxidase [Acidobacteriota bacterium]